MSGCARGCRQFISKIDPPPLSIAARAAADCGEIRRFSTGRVCPFLATRLRQSVDRRGNGDRRSSYTRSRRRVCRIAPLQGGDSAQLNPTRGDRPTYILRPWPNVRFPAAHQRGSRMPEPGPLGDALLGNAPSRRDNPILLHWDAATATREEAPHDERGSSGTARPRPAPRTHESSPTRNL